MSKGPEGLAGHHVSPLRVPSQHLMGELKARAADGRQMYRMYYGEPDQRDNLAVGLCVAIKRTFLRAFATSTSQNRDVRTARDHFMRWLRDNGMTSGG
jgi:hypothetical protein